MAAAYVNSQPTAGSGVALGPGTWMKAYWADGARLLEMTRYGVRSPNAGGVVVSVDIYQRISNRPGYRVEA